MSGKGAPIPTPKDNDNHADQCNPNNPEYKGHDPKFGGNQKEADNHGDQLNTNNPKFQPPKK